MWVEKTNLLGCKLWCKGDLALNNEHHAGWDTDQAAAERVPSSFCSSQREEMQPRLEPIVWNFALDNHMRQPQKQTPTVFFQNKPETQSRSKHPKEETPTSQNTNI